MNKRTTLLIRTLLFLFVLNSLYLSLYFTHKPSYSSPSEEKEKSELEPDTYLTPFSHEPHSSKPWPILPSYLPWTTSARSHSCEAYFGNGFTRRRDALLPRGGAGWFRCHHNDALRSSVCEGGRLRMEPEKITMAKGGEDLAAVMGRTEDEEMPVFQNGAFQVDGGEVAVDRKVLVDQEFLDEYVPRGGIDRHTMRDLIAKIRIVRGKDFQCDEVGAAIAFYAVPASQLADPAQAKAPVQAHFGELDNYVGFSYVTAAKALEEKLKASGVPHEVHIYPGNAHAFMNRSTEVIQRMKNMGMLDEDEASVQLAWSRFETWMTHYLSC